MKKLISIILTLLLCLTFAACSTTPDNNESKLDASSSDTTTTSSEEPSSSSVPSVTTSTPQSSSSKKPTSLPTTKPTTTTSKPTSNLSGIYLGKSTATKWESKSLKMGFTALSGWQIATASEVAEMNKISVSDVTKDISLLFKNNLVVYDTLAASVTGDSINIVYEKLDDMHKNITVEEYLSISSQNLDEAFMQMGCESASISKSTFTFLNKETPCLEIEVSRQGQRVFEVIICKKVGNYMCCITMASPDDDALTTISNSFYAL